jgi:hypothetical protein
MLSGMTDPFAALRDFMKVADSHTFIGILRNSPFVVKAIPMNNSLLRVLRLRTPALSPDLRVTRKP